MGRVASDYAEQSRTENTQKYNSPIRTVYIVWTIYRLCRRNHQSSGWGSGTNLHLGDGGLAHGSVADRKASDPLFSYWAVEDAVRPELLPETDSAPEHTSKSHVFPERYLR